MQFVSPLDKPLDENKAGDVFEVDIHRWYADHYNIITRDKRSLDCGNRTQFLYCELPAQSSELPISTCCRSDDCEFSLLYTFNSF